MSKVKSKNKFTAAMFDQIKDKLAQTKSSGGGTFANVMKFPPGHTYTLRIIPNLENPDKTFFEHYVHNWNSVSTGQFMSTLSLQTFNEPDPITDTFWKFIKSEDPEIKELGKKIRRKEQWFVNVYVVEDPSNPENNGTVKVLKLGKQLKDKVDEALTGDGEEEFGMRIFDLSSDGSNFKIKAEEQGEFVTFKNSRFSNVPKLELTDAELDAVYENLHDLEQIIPVKSYDELNDILHEHILGTDAKTAPAKEERKPLRPKSVPAKDVVEVDDGTDDDMDDIPFLDSAPDIDKSVEDLLDGIDVD